MRSTLGTILYPPVAPLSAATLMLLLTACSASPVIPSSTTTRATQPPTIAPLPPDARAFGSAAPVSSYPLSAWTIGSRYVLYADGTFDLAMSAIDYRGTYTELSDGTITFTWEGKWSGAGPWGATGTLSGETLTVRYNTIMLFSDFEDAVYTLIG